MSRLHSVWTEESQCTLLNATITDTFNCSFSCGPDCWKLSQYPCLQVHVNLTSSGERLLLYHTEETMKVNQKVGCPAHLCPPPTPNLHTCARPAPPAWAAGPAPGGLTLSVHMSHVLGRSSPAVWGGLALHLLWCRLRGFQASEQLVLVIQAPRYAPYT